MSERRVERIVTAIEAAMVIEKSGVTLIAEERRRQIFDEGYDAENDDRYVEAELAKVAAVLAVDGTDAHVFDRWGEFGTENDPWGVRTKFGYEAGADDVRKLTIAGALIAAEIDRRLRQRGREARG